MISFDNDGHAWFHADIVGGDHGGRRELRLRLDVFLAIAKTVKTIEQLRAELFTYADANSDAIRVAATAGAGMPAPSKISAPTEVIAAIPVTLATGKKKEKR